MIEAVKNARDKLGPKPLAEPEKELRFTRSRQGLSLLLLASILLGAALCILVSALIKESAISTPLWAFPPFALALALLPIAWRCLRHAYLILSPLGIEIFPFFNAKKNLLIIYWSEIHHAEISDEMSKLVIHFNDEKTAGVVASLSPIAKLKRPLLQRAIEGTMANRRVGAVPASSPQK